METLQVTEEEGNEPGEKEGRLNKCTRRADWK